MAHYMIQAAYTPEAWAAMIRDPQNRVDRLRPVVQKLGGDIEAAWLCFGDYDIIAILVLPDNVSAAAFSVAAAAGGAVKAVKTTPLMSLEDGIAFMQLAGDAGYSPPS